MKKILTCFFVFCVIALNTFAQADKTEKKDERPVFEGILSYYGKVTRIPDRSKTRAKLGDFDSTFRLYMNANFTKRQESFDYIHLNIVQGINTDVYYQTLISPDDTLLIVASPQEQRDYQLLPRFVRYTSIKSREVSGKRKINGYECKKVICDMITEDNIRIQLVAWYAPKLYIPNYRIPYFPELKGLPLIYDTYNGEHVVTYNVTGIKKQNIGDGFFKQPDGVQPIGFTQYMQVAAQQGQ